MLKRIARNRLLSTLGLTVALIGGPIIFIVLLLYAMAFTCGRGLGDHGLIDEEPKLRSGHIPRPQWTANGKQIVFFHGGVTHLVDAAGSRLRSLDYAISPNVSPDGTRIVYTAYERPTGWFSWLRDRSWDVVSSEIDGSDRRRLTEDRGVDRNPVWSPDGSRIALVSFNEDYKSTIHVIGAGGSGVRSVASIEAARLPPVWSPDGRSIAFLGVGGGELTECRGDRVLTHSLHIVAEDGSELVMVGQVLDSILPAWSTDGRHIVFPRLSGADCNVAELQVAASDGSASSTILLYPRGSVAIISWSPDGSKMLMGSLIVKADGSLARRVSAPVGYGSWFPDGSRIAVHVPTDVWGEPVFGWEGPVVLYTMGSDGTDIRVLVEQDEDGNLSAANGRPLNYSPSQPEQRQQCLELAEPGVLKYCEEE